MKLRSGSGYNLIKSDVFSLGLILLEAAIFMDTQDIYTSEGGLDSEALDHYIQIFKTRYPENNLITSALIKMLEIKESQRPDFKQIFDRLPPYDMIKKYFEENPELEEEEVI